MSSGTDTLIAGIVAAVLLPVLALGARMGIFPAGLIAIAVFFALQAILARRAQPRVGGVPVAPLDDASRATAEALLDEGDTALRRLTTAGRRLQDKRLRADVEQLSATAERVLSDVRDDPARAMSVRRLMTFYLPNAASVAEGWRQLETRAPSPERLAQTRETFAALNEAADRYAHALVQPQVQSLDLDLKVLNDALKSDLERLP